MTDLVTRVTPSRTTQRQGLIAKIARTLYIARGNDAAMRAASQLTRSIEANERTWQKLVQELMPR
jgi:hypothetical protein